MQNLEEKGLRVKLFTHTDLDGVGCEIVGRLAFDNIDVTHCDYHNVNEVIEEFIKVQGYSDFDKIYITDISVNKNVARLLDTYIPNKVKLIDHHETAEWMNNSFTWAEVTPDIFGTKQSGTNLFFEYLEGYNRGFRYYDALSVFVEKIRRYDTWDWKDIYNDKEAGELNQLMYLIGRKEFANSYVKRFRNTDIFSFSDGSWHQMFNQSDKVVIKLDNDKKKSYINRKNKQMKTINFKGNKVGVVFAEQYISELGNELNSINRDLEYIAIIDMGNKKVSLRTIHNHIHLGKDVASIFGGGGHAKASGFQFDDLVPHKAVSLIFETTKLSRVLKLIDKLVK